MATRGPIPTPTALKLVRGVRKDRINENEPEPLGGAPRCPSWLSTDARAEWRRWVKSLEPTKMLTQADRDALAALCEATAVLKAASADVEEHGVTVYVLEREFEDGTRLYAKAATNPAANAVLKAAATIRALASEFGGTPSARSRLHAPQKKAENPKEDLLSS